MSITDLGGFTGRYMRESRARPTYVWRVGRTSSVVLPTGSTPTTPA
jgi:hypothetical protein